MQALLMIPYSLSWHLRLRIIMKVVNLFIPDGQVYTAFHSGVSHERALTNLARKLWLEAAVLDANVYFPILMSSPITTTHGRRLRVVLSFAFFGFFFSSPPPPPRPNAKRLPPKKQYLIHVFQNVFISFKYNIFTPTVCCFKFLSSFSLNTNCRLFSPHSKFHVFKNKISYNMYLLHSTIVLILISKLVYKF